VLRKSFIFIVVVLLGVLAAITTGSVGAAAVNGSLDSGHRSNKIAMDQTVGAAASDGLICCLIMEK